MYFLSFYKFLKLFSIHLSKEKEKTSLLNLNQRQLVIKKKFCKSISSLRLRIIESCKNDCSFED